MGLQRFVDMPMSPPLAALPTITATTETVLVPTEFTPIPAWEPYPGKTYKLTVAGTCTTGTAGTLIITPRFGLVIGGVSIGPSPTQNYVPSITLAPFVFEYWLQFRTIQLLKTSATSTCVGWGWWKSGGAVATLASATHVGCAPASASVDLSVAAGLWIGVTFSVAPSVIPQGMIWQPLN